MLLSALSVAHHKCCLLPLTSRLPCVDSVESEAEVGEANKKTNTVIAFYLQSNAADGQRRIDAFVNAAYTYYQVSRSCCTPGLHAAAWSAFTSRTRASARSDVEPSEALDAPEQATVSSQQSGKGCQTRARQYRKRGMPEYCGGCQGHLWCPMLALTHCAAVRAAGSDERVICRCAVPLHAVFRRPTRAAGRRQG